ncbi:hypothetical protein D3C83_322720 [compost metagenome]
MPSAASHSGASQRRDSSTGIASRPYPTQAIGDASSATTMPQALARDAVARDSHIAAAAVVTSATLRK